MTFAVFELQFARRANLDPAGVPILGAGVAGVVAGIVILHVTDSIAGN